MTDDSQVFAQLDAEKIKEEAKAEAVKAAKDALINTLQGDKPRYAWEEKGKKEPSNYDELFEEVDKRVPKLSPEDIDKRVEAKLQEKEDAERRALEEKAKRDVESIEESRKRFDSDWYSLVQEGKMPAVAPELQERINKGDKLTKDEILADEGLKARLELAQLATNKSAKLAYYEDYQPKQPAGANAPVFGGRPSSAQTESQELDYEKDVKANRKRVFGW